MASTVAEEWRSVSWGFEASKSTLDISSNICQAGEATAMIAKIVDVFYVAERGREFDEPAIIG